MRFVQVTTSTTCSRMSWRGAENASSFFSVIPLSDCKRSVYHDRLEITLRKRAKNRFVFITGWIISSISSWWIRRSLVSKNGLVEPFMYKTDHFAKTGSGQT